MSLNLRDIYQMLITRQTLAELGSESVYITKKRTQEGKFLPGSSSGAERYSEKPFALPAGAVSTRAYSQLNGNDEEASSFITRNGELWLVIKGGYKKLRELEGLQSSKVDLKRRPGSGMLNALNVIKIEPEENAVEVGFTDRESEQIAIWHQIKGAGKNKVIRKFVGHTTKEESTLSKSAQKNIFQNITRFNQA